MHLDPSEYQLLTGQERQHHNAKHADPDKPSVLPLQPQLNIASHRT